MAEKENDPMNLRYTDKDGRKLTAKECLAVVWNSWLTASQMIQAKHMATDPAVTEEQAEQYLRKLEDDVEGAVELWRQCQ